MQKVTALYKDYYTAKWAAANEDVLAFFAPIRRSPLENAYLLITGWKPSMAFQLIDSLTKAQTPGASLAGMTDEQMKKIEALREKIKAEEDMARREMDRQQMEAVELAMLESRVMHRGGLAMTQVDDIGIGIDRLTFWLGKLVKMVDCARLTTLNGALDVPTPIQCGKFFAAISMLHIHMRK